MTETKRTRRFCARTRAEEVIKGIDVHGKTIAITGTTNGIGVDTAEVLAIAGAHVVLLNRNLAESEKQKARILEKNPNARVDIIHCDLNSVKSARKAGEEYVAKGWPLHSLILNAGVMMPTVLTTADGLESHFGVNVLAHFSLLRVLLPVVRQSAPSRILLLSSALHARHNLKPSMTTDEKVSKLCAEGYNSTGFFLPYYGNSKMADMLIAFKLHRDEFANGISTYSVHPGDGVRTNLLSSSVGGRIFKFLGTPFTKNSSQGAAPSVYCAVHPEIEKVSGKYWESCWDDEKRLDKLVSRDEQLQDALWKRLEQLDDQYAA